MNDKMYGAGVSAATQTPKMETLPGILAEIEKAAEQLKSMTQQASENIYGPGLKSGTVNVERGSSIIGTVYEIRSILREAIDNQQRTLDGLAL